MQTLGQRAGGARVLARDAMRVQRANFGGYAAGNARGRIGGTTFLHNRRDKGQQAQSILRTMHGPTHSRRMDLNFHAVSKTLGANQYWNIPSLFTVYMERMKPQKDLPHGQKFLSRKSVSPEAYFPQVENPYDDGRNYCVGMSARTEDLIPFLMHEVDDRVSEAQIRRDVKNIAKLAPTPADFLAASKEWGWIERAEALSSRLIVHHVQLLVSVLDSQAQLRELRRDFSRERGILRQMDGTRFYAFPGTSEEFH